MVKKSDTLIRAKVLEVHDTGIYGPYVVAGSLGLGRVTFALEDLVWQEARWPKEGEEVELGFIRRYNKKNWAKFARFSKKE